MSLPLGHRVDREFVCMDCIRPGDHHPWGISEGSALDRRVGSGKVCSRCGETMPHLATVRLLPDGGSSVLAPSPFGNGRRKIVDLERSAATLVEGHALVYVSLAGGGPEVGLRVHADGTVDVWVHDHGQEREDGEPTARWTHRKGEA